MEEMDYTELDKSELWELIDILKEKNNSLQKKVDKLLNENEELNGEIEELKDILERDEEEERDKELFNSNPYLYYGINEKVFH